ncbi:hypothetical protein DFH05DRAFT_482869 [Lentinula detonsa]|uniref:Uncharacterized protein n=1 Tax=Lentinula detonsa TaxID=2804962 RepID=A0A9W8NS35_9AGAR|nr:hypothetical protein DFH05DRAFT_482869 [Lentinula detonsa]
MIVPGVGNLTPNPKSLNIRDKGYKWSCNSGSPAQSSLQASNCLLCLITMSTYEAVLSKTLPKLSIPKRRNLNRGKACRNSHRMGGQPCMKYLSIYGLPIAARVGFMESGGSLVLLECHPSFLQRFSSSLSLVDSTGSRRQRTSPGVAGKAKYHIVPSSAAYPNSADDLLTWTTVFLPDDLSNSTCQNLVIEPTPLPISLFRICR